jgi:insertion element IS1 protein InsB
VPEVKHHSIAMRLHARGGRDPARVLRLRTDTVRKERKKHAAALECVNTARLRTITPDDSAGHLERAGEAEMDAMGSVGGTQKAPRGLWHAIDHRPGAVVASVCDRRQAEVFVQRKALLEPCGSRRYPTDEWGATARHLDPEASNPGKRTTQQIKRKPLTLRTRMKRWVRQTICFSKSTQRHDIVLGFFVNRYACGRAV